jgi:tetratricopeptide (TPR) repeat protein
MAQKPLRWEPWIVANMSTEALVAKMKELVPGFDLDEFVVKANHYISCEDLSEEEYYPLATFSDEDEDFIWMACEELWKRLVPDRLAVEHVAQQLDDKIEEMVKAEDKRKWQRAVQMGGEAFDIIRRYIIEEASGGCRLRHEFYEKLRRSSLYDVDSFLDDFLTMLCDGKEYEKALKVADMLVDAFNDGSFFNYKSECLFALGRKDEGEQCCQSWIERDPKNVWPYIHAGDGLWWYRKKDYARAKDYYQKALDVARANAGTPDGKIDLEVVYDRLLDLTQAMGDHVEATHYRRQLDVLRSKAQKKVGRNDPCPCGSGKKYKKCCGRDVASEPISPPFDRRLMERDLLALKQTIEGKNFGSVEEMNKYMREINQDGKLPRWVPKTPLEQAQTLIYEALETVGRRRLELAEQALKISPDCADAYVLLAEERAKRVKEALGLYEAGVRAGERALGKKVFEDEVGHFWGMVETRPYMRARAGLAQCLWALGRIEEAISHFHALIRLNPNDNQGIRYILAASLLEVGDIDALQQLLDQYDEPTAEWLYTKALVAYIRQGDGAESRKLLKDALNHNPHVVSYLLGERKLPRELPERIGFGDKSEAVTYAAEFGSGWHQTEGAVDWLALVTGRRRGTWQRREKMAGIPEVFLRAFESEDRKRYPKRQIENEQEE